MAQVPPPEHAPHRGRFGEETYTQDSIVKVRLRRRRTTDAIPTGPFCHSAPVGYELPLYRASAGMSIIYLDNRENCPPIGKTHPNSAIAPACTLDDHYTRTRRVLAGDAPHDGCRRYSTPLQRRQQHARQILRYGHQEPARRLRVA